ncbi:hypothetical protein, partial [Pseudogemmobacter bohemicus]|uniref:hypothetical protein n=1 Tax=Pseudogemmobacter bohemicus TaxID=2250708 RepID=UPI0018E4EC6F
MAVIAIVAGGIIGLIHGLIALALGLETGMAALVWVLTGAFFALLIFRELYLAGGDAQADNEADMLRDDLLAMGE